jgi:DNA repair protein RAD7
MSRRPLKYRTESNGIAAETSAIRGPNSALTEFLRQQGISAEEIRQRHLRRLAGEEEEGEEGEALSQDVTVEEEQVGEQPQEESETELEIRIAARRKRRAAAGKDGDEYTDSEVDGDEEVGERQQSKRKIVGEQETCASCFNKFVINVYSKLSDTGGYLCPDCMKAQQEKERAIKKNQMISRKKRQKLAVALLDRQDVKFPTLQDLAIKKVTEKIYDVDDLGDIGDVNMKKIAKILCRNRSLDDNTVKLFLDAKLEKLEFWDCSGLTTQAYDQIAAYCPHLEQLTLLMCGRLHNDNLKYYGSNLQKLTKIDLDGPFLINNETWQNFFNAIGERLTSFKVANTHRFNDETLRVMLEKCGTNLKCLKLSRLDGLKEKESYDLMPAYLTQLEELEISYPHLEELVDDSMLINLLGINGDTMSSLVLDGCSALTDEVLINGIRPFGRNLLRLSLQLLDQITSEGFVGLFHDWNENYGLNEVYLRKCFSLGDEGIIEMLLHSGSSLVELSINSVKDLSALTFQIMKCPNLTYLDGGFVRSIDDEILELIGKNCPQLKVMDCYGNNRCTSRATIRDGLKVIGRQSDTV